MMTPFGLAFPIYFARKLKAQATTVLAACLLAACSGANADDDQTAVDAAFSASPAVRTVEAGVLNNDVPEALMPTALSARSSRDIADYFGLWSGHYTRGGADMAYQKPKPITIMIAGKPDAPDITVTTPYKSEVAASDITFGNGILSFEFPSGLYDINKDPYLQFADVLMIDSNIQGLVRLKLDNRTDFTVELKHVLEMEKVSG